MSNELVKELETMLADAASKFVKDNQEDAIQLGEDVVKAVLFTQVYASDVVIAPLSVGATLADIRDREATLAKRSAAFQLVAKAEKENSLRVKALKQKATDTALSVSKQIAALLLGVGLRAML